MATGNWHTIIPKIAKVDIERKKPAENPVGFLCFRAYFISGFWVEAPGL